MAPGPWLCDALEALHGGVLRVGCVSMSISIISIIIIIIIINIIIIIISKAGNGYGNVDVTMERQCF